MWKNLLIDSFYNTMRISSLILLIAALVGIVSCQTTSKKKPEGVVVDKPRIASVNYPLHYFSQRIGDYSIVAIFPIPASEDPAFFNPGAGDIEIFQSSDIIFLNGAGYAGWVNKVSLPERKFVNTSESFSDRYIKDEGAISHSHGPEGEHEHEGYAFTTWLDMKNAKDQASNVYASLRALTPDDGSGMTANYELLIQQLDSLDSNLKNVLDPFMGATVFASHPVYQYLGSGYGLNIKSEHWEPDQNVSDDVWSSFLEKIDPADLKLMLWEDDPSEATASRLEAAGFQIVVFRPCGNVPESGDFIETMNENVENLKQGLARVNLNP
jgi:zinc transport system substrate-binding protein